MAITKRPKKKGAGGKSRLSPEQKARRKRAEKAAIRRIAQEEGITQKEARRLYKDAIVEVLFDRPRKGARRKFIEIAPGKFREVPKGKPLREVNASGPIRTIGYIQKVQRMRQYWELVHLMADEYKLSTKDARKRISKQLAKVRKRAPKATFDYIIWTETGVS